MTLEVGGFVNEAMMYWNDGFEDNVYLVTNDVERSRFEFAMKAPITPEWAAGALIEIGVRGNRENRLDQERSIARALPDDRYVYWWLENDDLGRIGVGRTRMASYHIVHMMTANTKFFARMGIGSWIGDNGGGFFLRKTDGTLTTGPNALRWGDINAHAPAATPGEGERRDSVSYETPHFRGFFASAAYTGDGGADVALRYKNTLGDYKLAAGIGYADYWRRFVRRCAAGNNPLEVRCRNLGLSGSVMHVPTGLYVYGGYGQQHDLNRQALFQAPVDDVDRSYYLQAGIERKFFDAGKTTILAEFEFDKVGAGVRASTGGILNTTALGPTPLPPGNTAYDRMAQSKIRTWGMGINQSFDDEAVNLYLSGRLFDAAVYTSATGVEAGAVKTQIEPFLMIVGGAKVEF